VNILSCCWIGREGGNGRRGGREGGGREEGRRDYLLVMELGGNCVLRSSMDRAYYYYYYYYYYYHYYYTTTTTEMVKAVPLPYPSSYDRA